MRNLKKYLDQLKRELSKKKEEWDGIEERIKEVMADYDKKGKIFDCIESFYIKNGVLFIEASNKVVAQEIFWKSEQLKEKINQKEVLIRKIVIS